MGHLIIHYNNYGDLVKMYQCYEFTSHQYPNSTFYKNIDSTFYHSIKEMNLSKITDYTKLPSTIIIQENV